MIMRWIFEPLENIPPMTRNKKTKSMSQSHSEIATGRPEVLPRVVSGCGMVAEVPCHKSGWGSLCVSRITGVTGQHR